MDEITKSIILGGGAGLLVSFLGIVVAILKKGLNARTAVFHK